MLAASTAGLGAVAWTREQAHVVMALIAPKVVCRETAKCAEFEAKQILYRCRENDASENHSRLRFCQLVSLSDRRACNSYRNLRGNIFRSPTLPRGSSRVRIAGERPPSAS